MLPSVIGVTAIISFIQLVNTAPSKPAASIGQILKRAVLRFEDCGDDNDPRRIKAGQASADAVTLALFTSETLDDGTVFTDSKAFAHYYEGEDIPVVTEMFNYIETDNDPPEESAYTYVVSCLDTPDCGDSLALTDANPPTDTFTPIIRLCPKFFDPATPETMNDLASKDLTRNPGRRDNSWCQPGQPFSFFETAGHTILHEMTHLDQLGMLAGLNERPIPDTPFSSHGTEDIYEVDTGYDVTSPERSARKLRDNWSNFDTGMSSQKPSLERVENAEGYAAAATEFYFQKGCGWDEVMP